MTPSITTAASRRAILGGVGILAAIGAGPAVAATAAPRQPASASARLLRAIRLYDRVDAAWDRFDKEVEMPMHKALSDAFEAQPKEAEPPHEEALTTFVNAFGNTVRLSTASIGSVGVSRRLVSDPSWADMGNEEWRQAHREIAAAGDRRDAIIAAQKSRRAAFEADTRRRFRFDEIVARSECLSDRCYALWGGIVQMPAASLADVVAKLDFVDRTSSDDTTASSSPRSRPTSGGWRWRHDRGTEL
ncbi:hypothetical protein [Sphingomonas adhaesiva]|uniref:hypothetical protein n=1 Tax=Sphingomonas adhaesiva TaxID=28212 RepID=UPI002FF4C4C7